MTSSQVTAAPDTRNGHLPANVRTALLKVSDEAEAAKSLIALGIPDTDAKRYVRDWQAERALGDSKFAGRRATEIRVRPKRWLFDPWIPLGKATLLYGEEGLGKGLIAAMVAAQTTLGTLPGDLAGRPSRVEWVTFEDDPDDDLVPRLIAAGADLSLVTFHDEAGRYEAPLVIPDDVPALAAAVEARGSRLVIVDPLPDALREGLKDNNNGDVRKGFVPLQDMAKRLDCAVLGIGHPNKGATRAADKVMGSKAWRSVPRSVILLSRDPDDEQGPTRIMNLSKSNVSGDKPSVKARIKAVAVDGAGPQPRLDIEGESKFTDSDLVTFAATGKLPGIEFGDSREDRAKRLIVRLLEEAGGEIEARVAYAAGEADGIPEATMRRAREALAVSGGRVWAMPEAGLEL